MPDSGIGKVRILDGNPGELVDERADQLRHGGSNSLHDVVIPAIVSS